MQKVKNKIIVSGIIAFICGALLNLCMYLWILGEYSSETCFCTNIANVIGKHKIDVFFSGWLFTSLTIIFQLWSYLNHQLNAPLHSIPSDIIRKQAHTFGQIDITKICRRLVALETGIHSILWEFDGISDFSDFEKRCLNCTPPTTTTMHQCNEIKKAVELKRRHRITDIANCLIFNKWKVNFLIRNEFFAAETTVPSKITAKDKHYYKKQKEELKSKNVDTAKRLLILKRSDLQTEMISTNQGKVVEYINLNKETGRGQMEISLRIITFENNISDVFAKFNIDKKLFDFVISKKESIISKKIFNKITVFAQSVDDNNDKLLLRSFDSTHEIDRLDIDKFLSAFDTLYNTAASASDTTDEIRYSKEIKVISDIETHMYT